MPGILNERILKNEPIGPSIYRMTLASEAISSQALAGQFVNIKCADGINALLRRPISICNVDREKGSFDIVYQVKGAGTELLALKKPGETVDLLGPLGKEFDLDVKYRRIAVLGGGIGIFPLLLLLKNSKAVEKKAFLGFRSKEFIVLKDEFEKLADTSLSTDDGSAGYHGLVTDLLESELQFGIKNELKSDQENKLKSELENGTLDIIYACGPTPMIKKAAMLAEQYNVPCQISMEQRMGCGIGACLVCACKTKTGDEWEYSHVCKDGPVFWSTDVIFEQDGR